MPDSIGPELRIRRRDLGDELDDLAEVIAELTAGLRDGEPDADELAERRERLAWLSRQQAGVLAVLGETERALLALGEIAWDD
ncbi:MAG: hypothetical protein LM550_10025 [Candidatus Contendobacter sp.]|jgi:hypothetical protein|nr:hypothetical protein [Gammaproteobacteria bacterium]MCC8994004.1 hypothetical protein [Candidatus Contendobacter sp.]